MHKVQTSSALGGSDVLKELSIVDHAYRTLHSQKEIQKLKRYFKSTHPVFRTRTSGQGRCAHGVHVEHPSHGA
jgi:hypothetical protein